MIEWVCNLACVLLVKNVDLSTKFMDVASLTVFYWGKKIFNLAKFITS